MTNTLSLLLCLLFHIYKSDYTAMYQYLNIGLFVRRLFYIYIYIYILLIYYKYQYIFNIILHQKQFVNDNFKNVVLRHFLSSNP